MLVVETIALEIHTYTHIFLDASRLCVYQYTHGQDAGDAEALPDEAQGNRQAAGR
jgi:hypothetical protein